MPENPENPSEVNATRMTYKPEVLAALREFRHARPWRGTIEERKAKFQTLHDALCRIYGREVTLTFEVGDAETPTGNGWCAQDRRSIGLTGKLSVVTFLHEWAHVIFGWNEARVVAWSVNLYRRIFRRSAARMTTVGPLIVRPEAVPGLLVALGQTDAPVAPDEGDVNGEEERNS